MRKLAMIGAVIGATFALTACGSTAPAPDGVGAPTAAQDATIGRYCGQGVGWHVGPCDESPTKIEPWCWHWAPEFVNDGNSGSMFPSGGSQFSNDDPNALVGYGYGQSWVCQSFAPER